MNRSMKGFVSVIIITYNQKNFITDAIMSVIQQKYNDFELIVADDGSTDGTQEIIKALACEFPDKIVPALGEVNKGIAANANRGLEKAKGEYIAWLGGDDLMLTDKLGKQVTLLESRPDAAGCVHDAEVFQSETSEVLGRFSEWANGNVGLKEGGVELWFDQSYKMLPSTMMFRSAAMPTHGLDVRLKYTNDWLFDVEVFRNGKVVVLNEVLGKYRRHGANVTGSDSLNTIAVEDNLMAAAIIEARYPELANLCKKKRQIVLLGAAKRLWSDDKKRGLSYLRAAIVSSGILSFVYIVSTWLYQKVTKNND